MAILTYTPIDTIPLIHAKVHATFKSGRCRPLSYRRQQLYALVRMCQENVDAIADALYQDLKKPRLEAVGYDIGGIVHQALAHAKSLEEWAEPEVVDVDEDRHKRLRPTILKTSKGPILGMAPWNFPFYNQCFPLIVAITTGNPCVLKASEISEHSAQLFAKLVPKYLDSDAYVVVNGGVPETTRLLELKWAHILYTGNGRVARIISAAAAKHLTPVTLELGGKSPVIIDPDFDIKLAAERILSSKIINAGQICMAPDYILIRKDKQEELVSALKAQLAAFYPNGQLNDPSYASIVSPSHFRRLTSLLERSKGTIALAGKRDQETLQFETTVVADVSGDDSVMSEELFGPILPIVPVSSAEEVIEFINSRDHPLVIYAFTNKENVKQSLIDETISGSIQFNGTLQVVPGLPFGGVGESGHGSQGYKHGFDDIILKRSFIDVPLENDATQSIRYPPYSDQALKTVTAAVFQPIPSFT